jgi:hypothetical protein
VSFIVITLRPIFSTLPTKRLREVRCGVDAVREKENRTFLIEVVG